MDSSSARQAITRTGMRTGSQAPILLTANYSALADSLNLSISLSYCSYKMGGIIILYKLVVKSTRVNTFKNT